MLVILFVLVGRILGIEDGLTTYYESHGRRVRKARRKPVRAGSGPVRTGSPSRARAIAASDSDFGPTSESEPNVSDADQEIPPGENLGMADAVDRLIEEVGPSADAGTRRVIEFWLRQGGCQGDVERVRDELKNRRPGNRAGYAVVSIKNAVLERRESKGGVRPRGASLLPPRARQGGQPPILDEVVDAVDVGQAVGELRRRLGIEST
jgi:hypothetical protein